MGARADDTEMDALAAHAHAHPELSGEAAERLIEAARAGDAGARQELVEHSLGVVLDQAVTRRDRGVEVIDLYQEGSMAAIVAVQEFLDRGGRGAQLAGYIRRVVGGHLDRVIEREREAAASAASLVEDTRRLEAAQVELRHRSGREPTGTELAAALQWSQERVELVAGLLATAREIYDADIVQYLDDASDEGEAGD